MSEKRKTALVMDGEGKFHIMVLDQSGIDVHNTRAVMKLFVEENEKYGEAEVFEEFETVDS